MAPFPESFRAFAYQTGIDRIRDAFRASVATMEAARQTASDAQMLYLRSGDDDREYDEDGVLIRSTAHQLDFEAMNATLAVSVVREAFVTSAFHYWEVSARGWTGLSGQQDAFKTLRNASVKHYPLSPQLIALNHLNNTLKHDNAYHARELAKLRTDHFARLPSSSIRKNAKGEDEELWSWSLRLTDTHVEGAFGIIRASGPNH